MKTKVLFAHRARRIFLFCHLWIGLIIGVWFSLIGLTGSALAWRFELQGMELARRFPLEKSAHSAAPITLSSAIAAVRKAHPEAKPKELATVTIPNHKLPFYAFSLGRDKATRRMVLVDPYSAAVHPPVQTRKLTIGTIQQFHERLLSGAKGYLTNGFCNTLAVVLVLSGLWLWWPTKLKHLKAHLVVKRGVSLKRTMHDLHLVLGIYLYPILLVTTLTGAMMVQQHIAADGGIAAFLSGQKNTTPQRSSPDSKSRQRDERPSQRERHEPKEPTVNPQGERLADDELLERAKTARPSLELTRIQLPLRPNQAAQLTYAKPFGFKLDETVFLNPYSGAEIAGDFAAQAPTRGPLRQWTRVLHLGEFGGVFTKLLYTITGLMPPGLFITGFLLWWKRKRHAAKRIPASTNNN